MKIIKHGNKLVTRRFVCPVCECVFDADFMEYLSDELQGSFYCNCPECYSMAHEEGWKPDETKPDEPQEPEEPEKPDDEQENPVF